MLELAPSEFYRVAFLFDNPPSVVLAGKLGFKVRTAKS